LWSRVGKILRTELNQIHVLSAPLWCKKLEHAAECIRTSDASPQRGKRAALGRGLITTLALTADRPVAQDQDDSRRDTRRAAGHHFPKYCATIEAGTHRSRARSPQALIASAAAT
jgi:hypothetical protein